MSQKYKLRILYNVEALLKDHNWKNILNVTHKYIVNVCSPVFDERTVRMRAEKTPFSLRSSHITYVVF